VAMHRGAPWWLAHECVAGIAYFCLFLFIMRESAWNRSNARQPAPAVNSVQPRYSHRKKAASLTARSRLLSNPTTGPVQPCDWLAPPAPGRKTPRGC
jgi:hypothetical protein